MFPLRAGGGVAAGIPGAELAAVMAPNAAAEDGGRLGDDDVPAGWEFPVGGEDADAASMDARRYKTAKKVMLGLLRGLRDDAAAYADGVTNPLAKMFLTRAHAWGGLARV